jgi:hypothetical protein
MVIGGSCVPGETRDCYTGEPGTDGQGVCRIGVQTCSASRTWSASCVGERTPAAMESCGNAQDDNCNGMVDEGCGECMSGMSRACYSGPAMTMGVGACRGGMQTCDGMRMWPATCAGEVIPQVEVCGNMQDDNCNGMTDEMCGECTAGETRPCYSGPAGTSGRGLCREGTQTCGTMRMWLSSCPGEVTPQPMETCGNAQDDNCNGSIDEMCGDCMPGEMRSCYTGPAGTMGMGICRAGSQTCGAGRTWGGCTGEVRPSSEMCGNMMDDNCNGMTDEMCGDCTPGMTRTCYTGPAGTMGMGICRGGSQTCTASRTWPTTCTGEVRPAASEMCGNMMDDNCNGMTDEMCGDCTPGMTRTCYTGPAGTMGMGICRGGSQTCTASRTWPATCTGEVRPAASETCGNSMDDNCNGMTDEGCTTAPANDRRTSATPITLTNGEVTRTGTTTGATYDGPAPGSCWVCTNRGNVWYSFTLTERTIVYADTAGSSFDTILQITDSAGNAVASGCNDDGGCFAGGFTSSLQSRVTVALNAGTYYIGVGGCGSGAFTLHVQRIAASFGAFVYTISPLTGTGSTTMTSLLSGSRRTPSTCGAGLGASGEDVRYFVTCGGQQQFFSLCQSDMGSYVRRSGTTNYDPIMYLWSAGTGAEFGCNDDGPAMGGTNCAGTGTGADTINYGSRLNNIVAPRGLNAVIVDERYTTSGMGYTLRHIIR